MPAPVRPANPKQYRPRDWEKNDEPNVAAIKSRGRAITKLCKQSHSGPDGARKSIEAYEKLRPAAQV